MKNKLVLPPDKPDEIIGDGLGFEVEDLTPAEKVKHTSGVVISKSSQTAEERNIYPGFFAHNIGCEYLQHQVHMALPPCLTQT